jgi:hypothetical protein
MPIQDHKGTLNGLKGGRDVTNPGVFSVGGNWDDYVQLADNQSFTFTMSPPCLFVVALVDNGNGAAFLATFASATIVKLADPSNIFEVTDTDTGKIAVFKGANSAVVTVKNYANAAYYFSVNSLGVIALATAPA